MQKINALLLAIFISTTTVGQKIEEIFLNPNDSTANTYIVVIPQSEPIRAFMFLMDGFGANPNDVLIQTNLPKYAATKGILSIIPVLKTGSLYFGSDTASQQSLKEMIEFVAAKYQLQGKDFYIGGFSIGGTCAVKYAELAVQKKFPVKPKAVFAIDPPLDWERFYNSAKRVTRLSEQTKINPEVLYMIDRIEKEMNGNPQTAQKNFHNNSPYSYSDTAQTAIRNLVEIPVMLITEPDVQWWLSERGYDYTYMNAIDHAAMINELQKLGNKKAILITTTNKGYRKPANMRHPHSWSIADPIELINWLQLQK